MSFTFRRLLESVIPARAPTQRRGDSAGALTLAPLSANTFMQPPATSIGQGGGSSTILANPAVLTLAQPVPTVIFASGAQNITPAPGVTNLGLPSAAVNISGNRTFAMNPATLGMLATQPLVEGWSQFTPSSDTVIIYVDPAGNDGNSGLSQGAPKRTVAAGRALMRNGFPDWLLLKRGGVWGEAPGQIYNYGRNVNERQLISSYGTTGGRPEIRAGGQNAFFLTNNGSSSFSTTATWNEGTKTLTFGANAFSQYAADALPGRKLHATGGANVTVGDYTIVSNTSSALVLATSIGASATNNISANVNIYCDDLAFVDVAIRCYNLDGTDANDGDLQAYGIYGLGQTRNLVIEGCLIDNFMDNIAISATPNVPNPAVPDTHWHNNVRIYRNVIIDAHHNKYGEDFYGQGLYAYGCNGLRIEENVFDHNGARADMKNSWLTYNRHNVYCANVNKGLVFNGNVSTSADCQIRGGGEVRHNLFIETYIALQWGIGTESELNPGGITGTVDGNVMLGGRDMGLIVTETAGSWNQGTLTLTLSQPFLAGLAAGALTGVPFVVTGGSGATVGNYQIVSHTASSMTFSTSIGVGADGSTNIAGHTDFGRFLRGINMTWNEGTRVLTFPSALLAGVPVNILTGFTFNVTAGAGATLGAYTISASSASSITLATSIGAGATNGIAGATSLNAQNQGARGYFMYTGNVASSTVSNNIIAHQVIAHAARAIWMVRGDNGGGGSTVGVNNMNITGNIIYDWKSNQAGNLGTSGQMVIMEGDNAGNARYSGNLFAGNDVQCAGTSPPTDVIFWHSFANSRAGITPSNNRFWMGGSQSQWFNTGGVSQNLSTWAAISPVDTTSTATQVATGGGAGQYPDPTVDMAGYMVRTGMGTTLADFITQIRAMDRRNWDPRLMPQHGPGYTVDGPLTYVAAGYGKTSI